jgi:hypothetical protein
MEVQSRRDTSAQSRTWKSNQEETHQHNQEHGSPIKKRHISTTALRANYVFICHNFAPPLPPFPMSWGKVLDPIWDSIARTTNGMD